MEQVHLAKCDVAGTPYITIIITIVITIIILLLQKIHSEIVTPATITET